MPLDKIAFWTCIGLVAYTYIVYPVSIWLMAKLFAKASWENDDSAGDRREPPMVSMIIAAHKEEKVILDRLNNAVLMDYPADRFEIIIGCDGQEDLTGALVGSFGDSRVRLIQFPRQRGKSSVLNDCVMQAKGEVVVFSDANTMMAPDAVRKLVKPFRDPKVGGVCGELVLTDPTTGQNVDGIYWRFENFIKRSEGRLGALLGVNGAIYAIRKDLYEPIPTNTIVDDFLIGMSVHRRGYRLIYEPRAVAHEETALSIRSEFDRRSRIGAGAFQSLTWLWPMLNPLRGRVAIAFMSHKLLRWFCPGFLFLAVLTNVRLMAEPFYLRILLLHELFYLSAMIGLVFTLGRPWNRMMRLPGMFVGMNAALAVGFWRWLTGKQGGTWKRTERSTDSDSTQQRKTVLK